VLLTVRDRTSVQQVKQLMPFIDFLLEEEEMSGKEIWLCVSNLRLFFKVYNPTAEDAFKAKVVTGAIKGIIQCLFKICGSTLRVWWRGRSRRKGYVLLVV